MIHCKKKKITRKKLKLQTIPFNLSFINFKIKDDTISYRDRGHINIYRIFALIFHIISIWGPSWSWSLGSWIYNCLCIPTFWVRIQLKQQSAD